MTPRLIIIFQLSGPETL